MKRLHYSLLMLLFLFMATVNAYSCDCAESRQNKEFKRSAAVFVGEFIRENEFGVELKVTKVWKGATAEQIILLEYIDIAGCDYDLRFISGNKYLIYAVEVGRGKLVISVDCGRSRAIEDAKADLKKMDKLAKN